MRMGKNNGKRPRRSSSFTIPQHCSERSIFFFFFDTNFILLPSFVFHHHTSRWAQQKKDERNTQSCGENQRIPSSSLLLSLTIIVRGWRTIDSIIVLFSRSLFFFVKSSCCCLLLLQFRSEKLSTHPNFTLQFFNCPVMNDSSMFISSVVLVFSMFDVCTRHIRRRREDDFFPPISTAEPNQIETSSSTMNGDDDAWWDFKGSNNSLSDVDATLYVIPFALLYSWFYVPCCLLRSFSSTFTTHLYIVFFVSIRLQ